MFQSKILNTLIFLVLISKSIFCGVVVLGNLHRVHDIYPGQTQNGNIIISNPTKERTQVKVYITDYRFDADGKTSYGDPSTNPRSNARWIDMGSEIITIEAQESYELNYFINVPQDSTLNGTYWSMVMIQEVVEREGSGPESGLHMRTATRTGIQMITNINRETITDITIIDSRLRQTESQNFLVCDIQNTGNTLVITDFQVELYNFDGNCLGIYSGEQRAVYPKMSTRLQVELGDVSPGKYKALIILDCGKNNVFGADYTLELGS